MPVRIPQPRRSELAFFGVAGVGAFVPFYMLAPGAEKRMATQTARWAPRWERNINFFVSPVERGIQKATPRVARTVQRIEARLPLEKMALKVDGNIKKGIDRVNRMGYGNISPSKWFGGS